MDSLTPAYRQMILAGSDSFAGLSILQHADSIGELVKRVHARTLLDFGCGRGDAYRKPHKVYRHWGLDRSAITLYDPSFLRDNVLPKGKFDVVLCSDVLEHVPEIEVDAFIERLFTYARRGVWSSFCGRPAKKTFPDGTNLHVTLHPHEWWSAKFDAVSKRHGVPFVLVETP